MNDRRPRFYPRRIAANIVTANLGTVSRRCMTPPGSNHALRQHGIGDLDEAGDVTSRPMGDGLGGTG